MHTIVAESIDDCDFMHTIVAESIDDYYKMDSCISRITFIIPEFTRDHNIVKKFSYIYIYIYIWLTKEDYNQKNLSKQLIFFDYTRKKRKEKMFIKLKTFDITMFTYISYKLVTYVCITMFTYISYKLVKTSKCSALNGILKIYQEIIIFIAIYVSHL